MDRKLGGLILALMSAPAFGAGNAPFCVFSSAGGASCFYYSIQACQSAARSLNGMCAPNSAAMQQQQTQPTISQQQQYPDIVGSYQRGAALGQQQRIQREEHEARMRLIEAQTQALQQQAPSVTPPPGTAIYECPDSKGRTYEAGPGCVVVEIIQ